MAHFRRNPKDDSQWVVADLPAGVGVGDKVMVEKRSGDITSVTIASILTLDDGTTVATIDKKRKGRTKSVTCPDCGHGFEV